MRSSLGRVAIALTLAAATPGVRLAAQVGEIAFANSGAPAAQPSFLAGLAQLHNFEYAAAAELFRTAQSLDPGFAMAYWGEAMTYNHAVWMEQDLSAARKALARLGPTRDGRAATAKTAREKDYMRAVEILYGEGGKQARDIAYADAMADIHRTYPEDPDAAAFYALSLLGTAHAGRDFAIYMRAASIVEPVFRDYPNHPGAAHYLIHAYDDPIHAPLGLRAARAYSKIAPAAGHAQHMTSHIFLALGLWDDLVVANEAGVRVSDDGRSRRGLPPSACGHYNFWLEYGYLQQRRFAKAKTLVANCYAAARRLPAAAPQAVGGQTLDPDNSPAGSLAAMRLRYLLDSEDWTSDVGAWTVATNGQWRPQVAFEFGTGYAALRAGRRADAAAALERLTHARQALGTSLTKPADHDEQQVREWARILEGQLEALLQAAEGRNASAADAMRALSSAEDQQPYEFGPPAIDKPSYELLGETLLAMDRPAEARAAFERALARTPERTAALRGLMLAAAKSGDERKATEIRARLKSIWHLADEVPALR
jgi:tetratricopeptide (TPR) repeat protein